MKMRSGGRDLGRIRKGFRLRSAEDGDSGHRRPLEVDPGRTGAYLSLGRLLLEKGARREAIRYLRHGRQAARAPEEVRRALEAAEAAR
jgi:hypothetical protein